MQAHHNERELANFIRHGAERRPDQAFGEYYSGKTASCDLDWFFDCLDRVKPCPHEDCRKRIVLAALLVHLNDDHRWSREQIAVWLETTNGIAKPVA